MPAIFEGVLKAIGFFIIGAFAYSAYSLGKEKRLEPTLRDITIAICEGIFVCAIIAGVFVLNLETYEARLERFGLIFTFLIAPYIVGVFSNRRLKKESLEDSANKPLVSYPER